MKKIGLIFGLLCMSAALALAVDQDSKRTSDPRDVKSANAPDSPATHKRPNNGVVSSQPKRNVHQDTTVPALKPMTQDQKAAAALPTVPKDAEEVGTNLYRTTDAQGKHWLYRKTPFGVSKWEEKPGDVNGQSQQQPPPSASLIMKDLGDSVEFQRLTPFGPQKWVRKKSEMTEEERASFETQEHAREAALGNKVEQH